MPDLLELIDVTFGYEASPTTLYTDLSLRFAPGWTGIIGPNGTGKTTLVRLATGALAPRSGRVLIPGGAAAAVVCPQRTDDPPDGLDALLGGHDGVARRLCGQLGLGTDWGERWSTLSHGERKRAQIGTALHGRPHVLALDEPTNHVDAETRDRLLALLRGFRGVGLVVSHDRVLLDTLCTQCLMLDGAGLAVRPGGYTEASALDGRARETAERAHERAARERKRLRRAVADRKHEAAQADRKRSKRGLAHKDHDAKARIDGARVSGRDGLAGRLADQLEGRLRQAAAHEQSARTARRRALGMTMRGVPARCDALWRTDGEAIGLGGGRRLALPALTVRPTDRIGLCGPNGSGKSTLVRAIVAALALPAERLVHLAQEMSRHDVHALCGALDRLPSDRRGDVLAAVDCLGSDPVRLLETETPSPGEARKLALALGLARAPHLIVMDEPTNHLDLPSIECLEAALRDCTCALLLVSHDERFLGALTTTTWTTTFDPDADRVVRLVEQAPPR